MPASSCAVSPAEPTPIATPALRVLVVDDEEGIRALLQLWLQRAGHAVTCVDCGHEAAKLLRSCRFDLVLTDVVMPDGDGYELIAFVKKLQPTARIVAMSGGGRYLAGSDCLKIARGLGAHAVVLKPFTAERVLATIQTATSDQNAS